MGCAGDAVAGAVDALTRPTCLNSDAIHKPPMTPQDYVQQKAAASGSSFYYAFLFLPAPKRAAITAFYAFCREVDDVVDDMVDPGVAATKLQWWRAEVAKAFAGTPSHPVLQALMPLAADYQIEQRHLQAIIDGCQMDLNQTRYLDYAGLQSYCHLVAGVVGEVAAQIFGQTDPKTTQYAHTLGQALQLTNIIRDVGEDARRGRIYLPVNELKQFGVTAQEILNGTYSDRFTALMRFQAERAQGLYDQALALLPAADCRAQKPGLMMASIYRALLAEIERDNFAVLHQRISLTPLRKLWLAWKVQALGPACENCHHRCRLGRYGGGRQGHAGRPSGHGFRSHPNAWRPRQGHHQQHPADPARWHAGVARQRPAHPDWRLHRNAGLAAPGRHFARSRPARSPHDAAIPGRPGPEICRVADAAGRAGRHPASPRLVAGRQMVAAACGTGLETPRLQLRGHACPWPNCARRLTPRIKAELIDPLCVSALNTPPEQASAQVFLRVMRDALFGVPGGSRLLLPRVDLSALFPDAAASWVLERGGLLRLGAAGWVNPDARPAMAGPGRTV